MDRVYAHNGFAPLPRPGLLPGMMSEFHALRAEDFMAKGMFHEAAGNAIILVTLEAPRAGGPLWMRAAAVLARLDAEREAFIRGTGQAPRW